MPTWWLEWFRRSFLRVSVHYELLFCLFTNTLDTFWIKHASTEKIPGSFESKQLSIEAIKECKWKQYFGVKGVSMTSLSFCMIGVSLFARIWMLHITANPMTVCMCHMYHNKHFYNKYHITFTFHLHLLTCKSGGDGWTVTAKTETTVGGGVSTFVSMKPRQCQAHG